MDRFSEEYCAVCSPMAWHEEKSVVRFVVQWLGMKKTVLL